MEKITFESLPVKVQILLDEVQEIKSILLKELKPKETTKQYPCYLSIDKALDFIKDQGFTLSKSTLYKYTAKRLVPFSTFNGRIVFESKELITWCISQQNKRYNNK